jgi:hypothetical protein
MVLLGLWPAGCGDGCPRRLRVFQSYVGTKTGFFYWQEVAPDGFVVGAASAAQAVAGPVARFMATDACWAEGAERDESGWKETVWLDLENRGQLTCKGDGLIDPARCAPGPGDPQTTVEFTVARAGVTEIDVVLGD